MSDIYHIPVMVDEVCDNLIWDENGIYVDGTAGGGGHSKAILERLDERAKLIALDQDEDAIVRIERIFAPPENRGTAIVGNFKDIAELIRSVGVRQVSGIFLDLGVSSHQIDTPERGFSYRFDGPLDMRMSSAGELTAKDVINTYTESELVRIFKFYGEERHSRAIARRIAQARADKLVATTEDLRSIVVSVVAQRFQNKSLSRIFQALRIEVNQELGALRTALESSLEVLVASGRLVVLTYHSLEDRIVKQFFKKEAEACNCPPQFPECVCGKKKRLDILTRRSLCPDDAEVLANPRARSARLRAASRYVG